MKKEIFQDGSGNFYFVEYDDNNKPYKVYCDKYGNPMEVEIEIYQDKSGNLYYIDYDKSGKKYKVYCDEYGNPIKPNKNKEETKTKKFKISTILSILMVLIFLVGSFFFYQKFLKAKQPSIDISTYEVNFFTSGDDGEGKANLEIKKIPLIADAKGDEKVISELLNKPEISYSKNNNLKNGDQVEVIIKLKEENIKKYNLKINGEFKKTYTVTGLREKVKEDVAVQVEQEENTPKEEAAEVAPSENVTTEVPIQESVVEEVPAPTIVEIPRDERQRTIIPEIGVNLRAEPNDSSEILDAAKQGYLVQQLYIIINDSGEYWSKVIYDGQEGWMRSDLLD